MKDELVVANVMSNRNELQTRNGRDLPLTIAVTFVSESLENLFEGQTVLDIRVE